MKLTTTLNRIRACAPCAEGWEKLLKHLGRDFDRDAEINLLTILESNGVSDMLWALRATVQDSKRAACIFAIKFAEMVLPVFEKAMPGDDRPRKAIEAAKGFLEGAVSHKELERHCLMARDADNVDYAAHSAAACAAECAAHAAAQAAACDADNVDSKEAAYAAARAAAHAAACTAAHAAEEAAYAAASAAVCAAEDAAHYAASSYAAYARRRETAIAGQASIIRSLLES